MTNGKELKQFYVGCKQIQAWPADKNAYGVEYEDGYVSQSPKGVFDRHYLAMGEDSTKISPAMVNSFIAKVEVATLGDGRTTLVQATLRNGFTITETSTCVDIKNYDEGVGKSLCMIKVEDRVWELLGFMLCWAKNGLSHE